MFGHEMFSTRRDFIAAVACGAATCLARGAVGRRADPHAEANRGAVLSRPSCRSTPTTT